jgi:acyl-CoA thioesterase
MKSCKVLRQKETKMTDIKQFIEKNDTFAQHIGIQLLEAGAGSAKAVLKIDQQHLNAVNIVHGGAIYTLADLVFAAASNSHGNIAVAINASISYLKAVTGGMLTAEAQEVSCNRKLATYSIQVTDDKGDLVASFQRMVYRKKERIPI